jgi:LacI family transcriptional regulator
MPEPTLLQSASGVIAIGAHGEETIEWLKRYSRQLVFADFIPPDDAFDAVASDLPLAMNKLLTALLSAGYCRIGFAGWTEEVDGDPFGEIRCRSYISFMRQHGAFDASICLTEASVERNTEQSGYLLTKQLMSTDRPPDAIVTCNDNIAVGAYRALHELGLDIPKDVAVAGFNDIPTAQFLNPPLTTVRLPSEEIGEASVELLLERVSGRELSKHITLASEIRWRGSSRVPPDVKIA